MNRYPASTKSERIVQGRNVNPVAVNARVTVAPVRRKLRSQARPLPTGFPRFGAYLVSYLANRESLELTLESFRASDWGDEPRVFIQSPAWPMGKASASRNYKRALAAAAADGCDFALILEDDIRACRWLRHNLTNIPLVARDQCDYFSLFMPDTIASPWLRQEAHLGYRLAKPLYIGPNQMWEKFRLWGSQAYLLSRRFLLAALDRWDDLREGQDARVLNICSEFNLPMWYSAPCLIEHAPLRTAFATPIARAPDFDADFHFQHRSGFQPPEAVPGWLTWKEGKLLWKMATQRHVLELATWPGRATVCLAQQAIHVTTVTPNEPSGSREWVRRFALSPRVDFHKGDVLGICRALDRRFDMAFVDTLHDAQSVRRDIDALLPLLQPRALIAFHDYPDPGWPEVRPVVDDYARRLGWTRIAQADYLGVFQT